MKPSKPKNAYKVGVSARRWHYCQTLADAKAIAELIYGRTGYVVAIEQCKG
jgi:hypothetical protein